jgi:predicted RNase H-like HicB family nuclease
VPDFPGVISFGENLEEARRLLAIALVDMAETSLLSGEALPKANPDSSEPESDLEEPIHLLLNALSSWEYPSPKNQSIRHCLW